MQGMEFGVVRWMKEAVMWVWKAGRWMSKTGRMRRNDLEKMDEPLM